MSSFRIPSQLLGWINVQILFLEHGLVTLTKGVSSSSLGTQEAQLWETQVQWTTTPWWFSTHSPTVTSVPQSRNLTQVALTLTTLSLPTNRQCPEI